MRFFHISDLHIGKQLGSLDLTDDLRCVLLNQVLGSAYREHKPDGLIISGDIYDRASPSAEAVELFDEFLSRAAEMRLPVYAISGNHDNAQRVSYGRRLFSRSGIFVSEPFSTETPVTVIPCGNIDIALLPYISAELAEQCFPEEEIGDVTAAVKLALSKGGVPREGRPCILVAHQSVAGSLAAPIGTLDSVSPRVFKPFAYTALGHFHMPRNAGAENIRYCGSPLCYSQREAAEPQKFIDVIDIAGDGSAAVLHHPITPPHPVRIITGSYEELISEGTAASEDYLYIVIRGENAESDAARRLLNKFPNCVNIRYELTHEEAQAEHSYTEMEFGELFGNFFSLTMGRELTPELLETAKKLFEKSEGAV